MKKLEIRKFTPEGSNLFASLIQNKPLNIIEEVNNLVVSESNTIRLDKAIEITIPKNRFELASSLWPIFGKDGPLFKMRSDSDLWNWVSAAYLELLVLADDRKDINSKLGGVDRWILSNSILYAHRHLISGPFFAFEANYPEEKNAMCQLATPVLMPGELVERIAGKRQLASGSVCHLATLLYFDYKTNLLRDGITSRSGSPKKFSYYFTQIDRTLDYEGMSAYELLDLLPNNFSKWVTLAKSDKMNGK
jgi:hypothetical protein